MSQPQEEALIAYLRLTLPEDLASTITTHLDALSRGDFAAILQHPHTTALLETHTSLTTRSPNEVNTESASEHAAFTPSAITQALNQHQPPAAASSASSDLAPAFLPHYALILALASFNAFVQTTITGPPLPFSPATILFGQDAAAADASQLVQIRKRITASLAVDGEAVYRLCPFIELFSLSLGLLQSEQVQEEVEGGKWALARVKGFWAQSLIEEGRRTGVMSGDVEGLFAEAERGLDMRLQGHGERGGEVMAAFLLEKASVWLGFGEEKKARGVLDAVRAKRRFAFALTGRMGKRTRFQEKETSQLVVLAKSWDRAGREDKAEKTAEDKAQPKNLDLNDDTLLESISFSDTKKENGIDVGQTGEQDLPEELRALDPADQPQLHPLDSAILLLLASSISNTSPADGLTREETVPYAIRVLDGGSSNWQVYTQALLVRSRVEGYKSRTMERGLLQLQALVDQVIAETTEQPSVVESSVDGTTAAVDGGAAATTFLPRAKDSESAPITERLRYIFLLGSPTRWELEAELAARWVSLGGLRSALEIYERLEMWAEAALCWAATEREDKATRIVRRQLFHATAGKDADDTADLDSEKWNGPAREPPPGDAPRLYCILGDIDKDPEQYEKSWDVSKQRYSRAQRSLGRHYFSTKDFEKAANAYQKALKVNQLNQTAWFAYGCALLELSAFERAVEAFSRAVQLDDSDAEAWSNLAAALLNLTPSDDETSTTPRVILDDEEEEDEGLDQQSKRSKLQQNRHDALVAFKRAARLKHDSFRIWDNVLTVAASIHPPSFSDILTAQRRIIDLRGPTDGERCVDEAILSHLVRHIITTSDSPADATKPGLARLVVELVEKHIIPLITASAPLWRAVATLALWRQKPTTALESHEKAWRCVISQPGWEHSTSDQAWNDVVDATMQLVEAYESFGPMERTEGLGAGGGEVVAKDWRFKARSAIRGVMSRGKEVWEDTEGWEKLKGGLDGLRG